MICAFTSDVYHREPVLITPHMKMATQSYILDYCMYVAQNSPRPLPLRNSGCTNPERHPLESDGNAEHY